MPPLRAFAPPPLRSVWWLPVFASLAVACGGVGLVERSGDVEAHRSATTPEREWRHYLGDPGVTHTSPLAEIDTGNVDQLEVAWTYDARDASAAGNTQIQCNPLIVKGVLYGTSPSLRLFALDAASGEELWSFRPSLGSSLPGFAQNRGLVYWEHDGDERILLGAGAHLYAVDARSGEPVVEFGEGGRVDLREGLGDRAYAGASVVTNTPGILFEDLIIVGTRVSEVAGAAPGDVRAYDVRSGSLRWRFRTIPEPGEPGAESWPASARDRIGGANAWAGFSVDLERGLVFVPTGSAAPDFYGGDRAGDNLYANTLLALDARSGERRWHQQLVRHDLWDRDLPAPPNLVQVERDGRRVDAVAQITKTGHVFVFERDTGAPLFPIEEVAVVGPGVAGEFVPASQPLPTLPPPFTRPAFTLDMVTERTPEAHAAVLEQLATLQYGHAFIAPSVGGSVLQPGADGGAEWGGATWDAEVGLLYVNSNDVPMLLKLGAIPVDADPYGSLEGGYMLACGGCHGADRRGDGASIPSLVAIDDRQSFLDTYRTIRDGRARMPGLGSMLEWYELAALTWYVRNAPDDEVSVADAVASGESKFINAGYQTLLDPDGFPASKPPWGTLTAIDLDRGEHAWRIPLGDYPRTLAAGHSGWGAENYGGAVTTAGGLLFIAATPDAKFRAFDKRSGRLLFEGALPAAGFATPATYEVAGRQYVVIAAGGGKVGQPSGSHYVAWALPRAEEK
jgi:quinoprotein glucose dehydrogenase